MLKWDGKHKKKICRVCFWKNNDWKSQIIWENTVNTCSNGEVLPEESELVLSHGPTKHLECISSLQSLLSNKFTVLEGVVDYLGDSKCFFGEREREEKKKKSRV